MVNHGVEGWTRTPTGFPCLLEHARDHEHVLPGNSKDITCFLGGNPLVFGFLHFLGLRPHIFGPTFTLGFGDLNEFLENLPSIFVRQSHLMNHSGRFHEKRELGAKPKSL
jgi:hypothetical protein